MTTQTPTLATYLLAQIAADEAVVRAFDADPYRIFENHRGLPFRHDRSELRLRWYALMQDRPYRDGRAHVLATCAAHRAIVSLHVPVVGAQVPTCACCGLYGEADVDWPCPTLRALALAYADRPGFDPAWVAS